MNILEVRNLKKWFIVKGSFLDFINKKDKIIKAVDDVSFDIKKGSVFVLAGESGSGKSTIARLILKAIALDDGQIIFDGRDVTNLKGKELKWFRRNAQMVHQDPYASINPRMKIIDVVREPLTVHDTSGKEEQEDKVLKALEEVRLEPVEEIAYRYPHMLSGGQRQRVAIARALVLKPKLIIADEPVSMLDISVRAEILDLMKRLQEKYKISYLYITHDLSTARYIGDNIAILYKGKIVEYGYIDKVLLNPLHPYTKALVNAISEPDPNNLYREKMLEIKDESFEIADSGCRFYNRCIYAMDKCKNEPKLLEIEKEHKVACFLY
ncbi:MAG: oligopeptide ABC transporter ATP-binding protein [Candidatus Nitrosocaldaceae archaeon]|nr:MAG: oligopeptide ABC transporter ATP-binding protein [Candidatus Nitrosocaldaceae archaeon]